MANQAVVGVLRALLTADTAQYDAAMKRSAQSADAFSKSQQKIGNDLKQLAPQAERFVKSFQGDKLLFQANNLVAAVEKVGGAAKLTSTEQARINRTLTEAIAKYAALGKVAPQALLDLEQATRKTEVATKSLGQGANKVFQEIDRLAKGFKGGDIIGEASRMAAAVKEAGGAAKLTEAEQARVNKTLTEAIAKYQALGKQAPQAMRDLELATRRVEPPTRLLTTGMIALGSAIGSFIGTLGANAVQRLGSSLLEAAGNGAKLGQLSAGFQRLTRSIGESGDAMLGVTRAATKGLISDLDLMQQANKAILLGLPVTAVEMGNLSRTAVTLGRAMGLDATTALDNLITALGRTSPLLLDNLGLTVKVGEANEQYARSLNKTEAELTDAERKMAFYRAAMDAAARATEELGEVQLGVLDQLKRIGVAIENDITGQARAANESSIFARALGIVADELERVAKFERDVDEARKRGAASASRTLELLKQINEERSRSLATSARPDLALPPTTFEPRGPTAAEIREVEKASSELQKRFERIADLSDDLFGRDLIQQANDIASAIGSVGNVSKLSADKQREVNAAVTDALAVYARLGQEAPEHLRALLAATNTAAGANREWLRTLSDIANEVGMIQFSAGAAAEQAADDAFESAMEFQRQSAAESLAERDRAAMLFLEAELEDHNRRTAEARDFQRTLSDLENEAGEQRMAADRARIDRALEERRKVIARFTNMFEQLGQATTGRLGALFFGQLGHDPTGELKSAAQEAELEFLKLQRTGRATAKELQTAFERWRAAEERAQFTFGERWRQWLGGLKQTFVSILNDMLDFFVRQFVGGLIKGLTQARLGQAVGNFLTGATGAAGAIPGGVLTGAAGSAGAGAVAATSVAGSTLPSFGASAGILAAGTGVGTAAGAGTAAASGGLGSTIAGLATNPFTIAAAGGIALGLAIWKKGLFRGGEEALKVSPRRDQFLAQIGPPGTGPDSGFGKLAAQLTQWSGVGGGGPLFRALTMADTVKEWTAAQAGIVAEYARHGKRLKSFQFGGFTPPGVTELALVHGGRFGELHLPLQAPAAAMSQPPVIVHRTVNIRVQGVLDRGSVKEVLREHVYPELNREMVLDQHGVRSSVRKAGQT